MGSKTPAAPCGERRVASSPDAHWDDRRRARPGRAFSSSSTDGAHGQRLLFGRRRLPRGEPGSLGGRGDVLPAATRAWRVEGRGGRDFYARIRSQRRSCSSRPVPPRPWSGQPLPSAVTRAGTCRSPALVVSSAGTIEGYTVGTTCPPRIEGENPLYLLTGSTTPLRPRPLRPRVGRSGLPGGAFPEIRRSESPFRRRTTSRLKRGQRSCGQLFRESSFPMGACSDRYRIVPRRISPRAG